MAVLSPRRGALLSTDAEPPAGLSSGQAAPAPIRPSTRTPLPPPAPRRRLVPDRIDQVFLTSFDPLRRSLCFGRDLYLLQLLFFEFYHLGRQRRVVPRRRVLLPVVQCPVEKFDQRHASVVIALLGVNEQPGERGQRIGIRARRIGYRNAKVSRHIGRGARRRCRHAFERRLDPLAVAILNLGNLQLVG